MLAAPLTSLNPMIAAGWVAGLVEAFSRKPKVKDLERTARGYPFGQGILEKQSNPDSTGGRIYQPGQFNRYVCRFSGDRQAVAGSFTLTPMGSEHAKSNRLQFRLGLLFRQIGFQVSGVSGSGRSMIWKLRDSGIEEFLNR